MLHIMLMIASKMITINWMQPSPPTKTQRRQKIDMSIWKIRLFYEYFTFESTSVHKKMDPCYSRP